MQNVYFFENIFRQKYDKIISYQKGELTDLTIIIIQQIFRKKTHYFWCYFVDFFAHQGEIPILKINYHHGYYF